MPEKSFLSEIEGKFPYLFSTEAGGPPGEHPLAEVATETLDVVTGFLNSLALASLSRECVVDEEFASIFRAYLSRPGLRNALYLQERLFQDRKVPLESVFGLVPEGTSREYAFTNDYCRLIQDVRRTLDERAGTGQASPDGAPRRGFAERANELFAFLLGHFRAELLVARDDRRKGAPEAEPLSRPGEPEVSGLCLRGQKGKLYPLSPFVRLDENSELVYFRGCDAANGRLLHFTRGRWGPPATCEDREVVSFFIEFFLKTGAYQQAKLLAKALDAKGKTERNRRSALYATACHYGTHHLKQNEFAPALAEFEKAQRVRSDLPLLHFNLALTHGKLRDYDRAIDFMRRLLARYPKADKAYETMGDLYHEKGERGLALKMYEKAAMLNPLNRMAERKRARLIGEIKRAMERVGEGSVEGKAAEKPARSKIEEFLTDMTLEAELNLYHPAVGRDSEREEMMEILSCRNKNNVMIVGESGVGKTALVEDFTLRIVRGQVPPAFQGKKVYLMSVATLLAGAKFRGQFEERLLELIGELREGNCILFIDNIHNIISSGLTRGGTLDAANILKPSLIKGEIQVIGTTNWDEYRQNIEKEPGLARCFQILKLEEPGIEQTREIVEAIKGRYEQFHGVRLPERTVRETLQTVKNSLKEGTFPDKALEIYDRSCAMVSLQKAGPEGSPEVRTEDVLSVLSAISGIPLERLSENQKGKLLHMEEALRRRVLGQEDALASVSRVMRAAKLNLTLNPGRPKGVFLFVGPTGVGKTELARALAEFLFGDEDKMIRIDMSEYMERISSSRLIGTAPGYVGYNDQNQLTDEVRKNPYSLVLLDEIEKADSQMINLFLQVFDAGRLTDGKGRTVFFDNTTIIMTSNLGSHLYARPRMGYGGEDARAAGRVTRTELLAEVRRHFSPEFFNRIDEVVVFDPLLPGHIREIARMQFATLRDQLRHEGRELELADPAVEVLVREGYSFEHGARNLGRVIRRLVLEPLSQRALGEDWSACNLVVVDAADGEIEISLRHVEAPAAGADSGRAEAADEPAELPFEESGEPPLEEPLG